MKIHSYDPLKKERVEAGVFENGTFYKKVNVSNYMRMEQGYGISEDVIQQLIVLNCRRVIIDNGTTNFIIVDFCDWVKQPLKDYGAGLQRFYPVKKKSKSEHMSIL